MVLLLLTDSHTDSPTLQERNQYRTGSPPTEPYSNNSSLLTPEDHIHSPPIYPERGPPQPKPKMRPGGPTLTHPAMIKNIALATFSIQSHARTNKYKANPNHKCTPLGAHSSDEKQGTSPRTVVLLAKARGLDRVSPASLSHQAPPSLEPPPASNYSPLSQLLHFCTRHPLTDSFFSLFSSHDLAPLKASMVALCDFNLNPHAKPYKN